jgi:hypothetical protein
MMVMIGYSGVGDGIDEGSEDKGGQMRWLGDNYSDDDDIGGLQSFLKE